MFGMNLRCGHQNCSKQQAASRPYYTTVIIEKQTIISGIGYDEAVKKWYQQEVAKFFWILLVVGSMLYTITILDDM